jgi:hypothetical protein
MSEKKFEHLFWNGQGPLVPPRLDSASYLIDGEIRTWNGPMEKVYSPVFKQGDPNPIEIGSQASHYFSTFSTWHETHALKLYLCV